MIDRIYRRRSFLGLGAAIVALMTKNNPDLIYLLITCIGLIIRLWAVGYLGKDKGSGQPEKLITAGPYRLIRHPLYLANGLIILGLLLFLRVPVSIFALIMSGYLFFYTAFAMHEERILAKYSGHPDYRLRVSSIIPVSIYNKPTGEFSINNALTDFPALIAVITIILIPHLLP